MSPIILALFAVIIISLISVVGIFVIISNIPSFSKISLSLVGVAVGSLLGDAFIHILPEANKLLRNDSLVAILTISGMLLFFSLEKIIRWRHCHDPECNDKDNEQDHLVTISLTGELFHNFIDGVIIASSFSVSSTLGYATSLAVLIHEIPQEIGHFSIYSHAGVKLLDSLRYNLLASLSSIIGVIFVLLMGNSVSNLSPYILPITAGGFIYLAASDLIPELHRHQSRVFSSVMQIVYVIVGVLLMFSLLILE